ncbi:MAG: FecR domain-containing protein [Myxococcales bacterium]
MDRWEEFRTGLAAADEQLRQERLSTNADQKIRHKLGESDVGRSWGRLVFGVAAVACAVLLAVVLRPGSPTPRPEPSQVLGMQVTEESVGFAFRVLPDEAVEFSKGACLLSDETGSIAVAEPSVLRRERAGMRVVAGKVEFKVERQKPGRSVRVLVSGGAIEVVGTRFTVEQQAEHGRVMLHEGHIRFVAAAGNVRELLAGESLEWPQAPVPAPTPAPETVAAKPDAGAPVSASPPALRHPVRAPERIGAPATTVEPDPGPEVFERVGALRSRGQYTEAVQELTVALARPAPRARRERLSYELGSIYSYQLRDHERACAHWQQHEAQFPAGTYAQEIRRSAAGLAVLGTAMNRTRFTTIRLLALLAWAGAGWACIPTDVHFHVSGSGDSGREDAGAPADASVPPDAATVPDASEPPDAASSADAGAPDAEVAVGCANKSHGEICRRSAGACDLPEVCDGVSPDCPPDRAEFTGEDPAWCWQSPWPLGETISSLSGTASDDVWAAAGTSILHWDGQRWSQTRTGALGGLRKIRALSRSDAWAVGEAGTVLRWDGSAWRQSHPATNASYLVVWPSAADDVWLSDSLQLEHFDGQTFVPLGLQGLRAIDGLAANDVMGISGNGANTVVTWNGTAWTTGPQIAISELLALWRASADEAWAVGAQGVAAHRTGGSWQSAGTISTGSLFSVWGSGANDVWAGGEMSLLHWNGASWDPTPAAVSGVLGYGIVRALWGTGADDVWAGADGGLLLHKQGGTWRQASADQGLDNGTVRSLSATAPDDVWAASDHGVQHFDGSRWAFVRNIPNQHYLAVWAAGRSEVFAVGIQALSRFNGTDWSQDLYPTAFTGVSGTSGSDVWAVGENGFVAHWNGIAWTTSTAGSKTFTSVKAFASDAVWAVGQGGAARFFNGTSWEDRSTGTDDLVSVWGSSANDVWAAGPTNALLRWDGTKWAKVATAGTYSSVSGTGASDVWACGRGSVAHWDGAQWTSTRLTRTAGDLMAIWAGPADVWVAGGQNSILHRNR